MFRHLIKLLLDLIQLEHQQKREIEGLRREHFALHQENLAEARQIMNRFDRQDDRLNELTEIILEIRKAVIPEPVAAVKISDELGDQPPMDIAVGLPRQIKVETFGASGNPTVPVGAATLVSTNTTDFTVDSGALSFTPVGASGATTDISAVVDGVTSNVLSGYTIAAPEPPPVEPVASVVISDVTP